MKKLLIIGLMAVSAFSAPRYDYTIQDVFEYYHTNSNIVVDNTNSTWYFNEKKGYFNYKKIFFDAYIDSYGECVTPDNCVLYVSVDLPYTNLKRATIDVTTSYKNLLALKKGSISRQSQMICQGDSKGDFINCSFLESNKTN